ncbi:MAG: tRNA (adenosine(37)-N6)-threonylcarbamoyltransferase complex dimerization subunit type 1 TsaB [Oceanicoccus sp.]
MKLLALDCSTEACSVALLSDSNSGISISETFELAPRQHTQRILPMVDQLLRDCDVSLNQLGVIAYGRGPGSFTGLRICLGAVQGLAYGADLAVVGVSTLAAQAQAALDGGEVTDGVILSTLDARMDEVYWGVFQQQRGLVTMLGTERLTAPEQVELQPLRGDEGDLLAIGSGFNYASRMPVNDSVSQWRGDLLPRASAVAKLGYADFKRGAAHSAAEAIPVYLRDEVAWKKQPL